VSVRVKSVHVYGCVYVKSDGERERRTDRQRIKKFVYHDNFVCYKCVCDPFVGMKSV
jgi:hypothetical protein